MEHPISTAYLDLQIARASAALAAAGAFDTTPTVMQCPGFSKAMLFIEYERGGAGGDMQLKVEISPVPMGDHWFQITQYAGAAVASGSDVVSNVQRQEIEYGSTGAGVEKFTFGPIDLAKTAERMRVNCQESGAVGTPGTCKITAVFSE
jgi:hypothetical protein